VSRAVLERLRAHLERPALYVEAEECGVFIRLPPELAAQFPEKSEDSSPPHVTLCFIGHVPRSRTADLATALREALAGIAPFELELDLYAEFQNPEGATIAHMVPRAVGLWPERLAALHASIKSHVEARGVRVGHHPGPFRPHVTLAYVPAGQVYEGPKPKGRWRVDGVELWTGPNGHATPTVIPLQGRPVGHDEGHGVTMGGAVLYFDESKVKRDGGKFATKEGAKKSEKGGSGTGDRSASKKSDTTSFQEAFKALAAKQKGATAKPANAAPAPPSPPPASSPAPEKKAAADAAASAVKDRFGPEAMGLKPAAEPASAASAGTARERLEKRGYKIQGVKSADGGAAVEYEIGGEKIKVERREGELRQAREGRAFERFEARQDAYEARRTKRTHKEKAERIAKALERTLGAPAQVAPALPAPPPAPAPQGPQRRPMSAMTEPERARLRQITERLKTKLLERAERARRGSRYCALDLVLYAIRKAG